MRIAAGVLMIVGGLGVMLWANLAVVAMFLFGGFSFVFIAAMMVPGLALMVMSFVGAYHTLRRRRFSLGLAGALCSAVGIPFIPGLLAVVFVVLRREEFPDVGLEKAR